MGDNKHWYYICDACGTIVTITDAPIPEGEDWECECGSNAMWEFTDKDHAMAHSEHIQQLIRSGIFHKVSS